jgi:hypothetical protein
MKAILTALLLVGALSCQAGTVSRAGYVVAVPDGWKQFTGTCTGEACFATKAAILSIARHRYVDSSEEWVSTGDFYRAERFDDLDDKVTKMWVRDGGRLAARDIVKDRDGRSVLLFGFIDVKIADQRGSVSCAFVEDPTGGGALEIRLVAIGDDPEAQAAFASALASIGVKKAAQPGATDNPDDAQ